VHNRESTSEQSNMEKWCILHGHGWSLDKKNHTLLWCILGVLGLLIAHVYNDLLLVVCYLQHSPNMRPSYVGADVRGETHFVA